MQNPLPLTFGNYFHIYNHGVGERNLWVLMPNHFHLLVRIKEKAELMEALHLTGFQNLSGVKPPHQYFSNLFNAYTKALNIRLGCQGALFERPFKRKLIDNGDYLKQGTMKKLMLK